MSFANANVLITGGMGFIGSAVARALVAAGARVTLLDDMNVNGGARRRNVFDIEHQVDVRAGDVRDLDLVNELVAGKQYLFNLAALTSHTGSMNEPLSDFDVNARAQIGLLEACRRLSPEIRIVYASTRQVYGRPQYLPVDESHPIRPVDVNGVSKLAGEHLHLLYHDVYGLRATVLRLTNTYGPGMRVKDAQQGFMGLWFRLILQDQALQIFGDGAQRRDAVYVDDCVDALLRAVEGPWGKAFNLSGDQPLSLAELAQLMVDTCRRGRIEFVPFPAERKAIDIGDYRGDSTAFRAEFNWRPSVDLATGIRRTFAYYGQYLSEYL
jgi:UDP-glucose 4-epimerase